MSASESAALLAFILIAAIPPFVRFLRRTRAEAAAIWVRVVRVIDGDTFEIEMGERVRLAGVDAPELKGRGAKKGREASDVLKELIEGRRVRLVQPWWGRMQDRDVYGRLVRLAYLEDGRSVGGILLSRGLARRPPRRWRRSRRTRQ